MHWIAIHEEVLGSKLRGFRKSIKCSEAEALGILTMVWLWARKNADITGLLGNVDRSDIADVISSSISKTMNADKVADALIEEGWIDEIEGELYIHDWYEWQQYWYTYLEKKEKDKIRKRIEREKARENNSEKSSNETDESKKKRKKISPPKPQKNQYAESVYMLPEEHQKLVDRYGSEFTKRAIEELNNYKMSVGKKYKDDYRAILSWVVEKCEKKYPNLKSSKAETSEGKNPFVDVNNEV